MFEEKEYSPYRGLLVSCIMLIIFPICLMILFSYVLRDEYTSMDPASYYTPIFFGSLCGNIYHIILFMVGAFKKSFIIEVKRVCQFFSDLEISFKLAKNEFIEDVKEKKMIFWIYFGIILLFIILTIFCYCKIMN